MFKRDSVHTLKEKEIKNDPINTADKFFTNHIGIHKLVVDDDDRLRGLFTLSDIERINGESNQEVKPPRRSISINLCRCYRTPTQNRRKFR